MSWPTLTAYIIVVIVSCVTPGPVVLLVLSQAMTRGAGKTLWSILGIMAGNTFYFVLAAIGVGAILFTFHDLFLALRWIGIAYLVWLGLRDIFGKTASFALTDTDQGPGPMQMFYRGFLLQMSNPASWLFFTAMLPPFINTQAAIVPQMVILTLVGNAIEFLVAGCFAVTAARLGQLITRPSTALMVTRLSGVLLIAAALSIAFLG